MGYKIELEESRRYHILKALMCLFVVFIHSFSQQYNGRVSGSQWWLYQITFTVSRIICDCAVPVFMLISSVMLYAKPFRWWQNVKKKARTLLIPYVIFNSLWIVVALTGRYLSVKLGKPGLNVVNFDTNSVAGWLNAYLGFWGKPALTLLWYVRDLFLLNLLAVGIKKLVDRLPILTLILTIVWCAIDKPISVLGVYSVMPFVLGCYLVKYNIHMADFDRKLKGWLVASVFFVVLIVDILLRRNIYVHYLFVLCSMVFYLRLSRKLLRIEKPFQIVGAAGFFIYLSHLFVLSVLKALIGDSFSVYFATYFLLPPVVTTVLLGVFCFMRRFMPGLLGILTGGRRPVPKS